MSKPGTTWFRSKRKLTALVAGAAILAGTIGATAPQPDAELAARKSSKIETTTEIGVGGETSVNFTVSLKSTWS